MTRGFPVTDPYLDAPDGAVIDGYERCGSWWHPLKEESMNFGQALEALKKGKRIARKGWNGKGMWLALWEPGTYFAEHGLFDNCPAARAYAESCVSKTADIGGSIVMLTADGSLVFGWLASQTDMLAEDWEIVE